MSISWIEFEKLLTSGKLQGKVAKDDLPTPALIVDLNVFEANLQKMAGHLKDAGKAFRPHAKTHKSIEIAKACVDAGAVGTCTAKISEAEVFAGAGLTGLLITTPLVGAWRIERAILLAQQNPDTVFCADHIQNVELLNQAASAAGIRLQIAIDLLVGGRTGISPGKEAVELARQIHVASNLSFAGIQAFAGPSAHTHGFEKRKLASQEAMGLAVETRWQIQKSGVPCPWLSGGSTGTYNIDSAIDGITELQPGSFLFMDIDYKSIGSQGNSNQFTDFGYALSVIATVFSKPSATTAIVDAGFKAFSTDRPFPPQLSSGEAAYNWAGDEHGKLELTSNHPIELGDRLEFYVPHCDPTVNLYDHIYGVRGELVEIVWKVQARGNTQ